ncbi:hypothetical protein UR09_03255 [Candidatus Nitromaritima sp. SCGC AAA799-A02]|nr:hypothetical protein UR09_03255 [Candidatus Nitromaritima sp. SCGC AAA799-A02]
MASSPGFKLTEQFTIRVDLLQTKRPGPRQGQALPAKDYYKADIFTSKLKQKHPPDKIPVIFLNKINIARIFF